jgi:hypothetical protein
VSGIITYHLEGKGPSLVDLGISDQRVHVVFAAEKLDELDVSLGIRSKGGQFGAREA